MSQLRVALLGAPEIDLDGKVLTFPTRKAFALLSYLVVEGGVQPRERITALFWPESRADLGRAALRKTLAYLRQALGAPGSAKQEQPYILADRDSLQFNPAAASVVDVWLLQSAAQALRQPPLSLLGRSPSDTSIGCWSRYSRQPRCFAAICSRASR